MASAFVASLRACAKSKDLCRGSRLHDDIARQGLLPMCSDALVTMYARCGALERAREVFDMHQSKCKFTWTALIAGYAQKCQGQHALDYYERMRSAGLSPDALVYSCVLTACGSIGACDKGEKIHEEIAMRGLLQNNIVLGNVLVTMYAKCGALTKAQRVLEELAARDVVSWSALIAGYAQHGKGEQALICFEMMQRENVRPNMVTFISILKACGSIGAIVEGEQAHNEIAKQGLLANNIVLSNALVDMYAKCGALAKARQVLEDLPARDVISWNTLIAGYAQQNEGKEALNCFEKMQREGLSPNAVTFVSLLRACGSIGAADKGEEIHNEISKQGSLRNNPVLGIALVDMYAKCSAFGKARQVLEQLPVQDVIVWNALMAGYTQHGKNEDAVNCYEQMQRKGLSPDAVTYISVLKACGNIGEIDKGEKIHEAIAKQGLLGKNSALGTALLDMYVKCGALTKAQLVLEELPRRNAICWNALIAGYTQNGQNEQALKCFEQMQREGFVSDAVTFTCVLKACGHAGAIDQGEKIHDQISEQRLVKNNVVLGTALVDMYAKCGALAKAHQVLEELPIRDVVTWNALISGYAQQGDSAQVLSFFEDMQREGVSPDSVTFICMLKACGSLGAADKGERIHDEIARRGLLVSDIVLGTALVDMYAKCGCLGKARRVLEELPVRDVISWNTLITGYVQQGQGEQALNCFEQMQGQDVTPDMTTFICILKACGSLGDTCRGEKIHDLIDKIGLQRKNIVLGTALVDMYAKCGMLTKARQLLEELPTRDVISWNALIAGCVQHGEVVQALSCFDVMRREGVSPNASTFMSILKACSSIGAADSGERIDTEIAKRGLLESNLRLGTALVDMYANSGALARAQLVLEELPLRNVSSWNALIGGSVQQGEGEKTFGFLQQMELEGFSADAATFSCVLNACSRLGLVEDAEMFFESMSIKYGIEPDVEHYTCMADLFARAGHLDKAVRIIKRMSFTNSGLWSALLCACRKWGDVTIGRWAFENAIQVNKCDAAAYVLMAEIYVAAGMKEDAEIIEVMRLENKAWKRPTESLLFDVRKNVFPFFVSEKSNESDLKLGDRSHNLNEKRFISDKSNRSDLELGNRSHNHNEKGFEFTCDASVPTHSP